MKFYKIGFITLFIFLLAGCSADNTAITNETPGFFNHYFIYPFSYLLTFIAHHVNGSYGLSIVCITVLIRFVLLPFAINQYKSQDKLKKIQPEMQKVQEKMKQATSVEEKQQSQREMMELYSKHGVNPVSMGCLPLFIQFPILIGFYHAIIRTHEIANHSFLWFNLGHPNIPLALLAGITYVIQFKVSQIGLEQVGPQQKMMSFVGYFSAIMMAVFSFSTPSALPLYWTVGGIFVITQTLILKYIRHQHEKKEND